MSEAELSGPFDGLAVHTFGDLQAVVAAIPDQMPGIPDAICLTGEPYVEIHERSLARPADVDTVTAFVMSRMCGRLNEYFKGRKGTIYWRIPLEFSVNEYSRVIRFDENGPDRDFMTDQRCVLDRDWKLIACYGRLYRAHYATNLRWQFNGHEWKQIEIRPRLSEVKS